VQIFRSRFYRSALVILCAAAILPASSFATPRQEISRAVAVNGTADAASATPKQFLKAFTAVTLRAQPRALPDYVIAAIDLRPELASNIVAVAIKAAVRNWADKPSALCAMIDRIVRAGIAANPDAVVSVVKAATSASPTLRHCVVNGAITAAPMAKNAILQAAAARTVSFVFPTFSGSEQSGFSFVAGTLSPANISDLDDNDVNSPEQPPAP
jgi:hypothetical protein